MKTAIILSIWLILFVNFTVRDLCKHGKFDEYKKLVCSNAEEKYAYTYGRPFYEFLKSAKGKVPVYESYEFSGIPDFSLDSRRGVYYLYPRLKKQNADYILVYGMNSAGTGVRMRIRRGQVFQRGISSQKHLSPHGVPARLKENNR